jgi:hypothetical protein
MMTKIILEDIPFERQSDSTSNRMCGAAALTMVLHAYGLKGTQAELWPKVSKPNASGQLTSRSFLIAREAHKHGLSALVIQARNPLKALELCHQQALPVVLNHRLNMDSPAGHYSVLVGMGQDHALVHDPQIGPTRRLPFLDLLKLWRPRGNGSEITGNVLIAFAQSPPPAPPCSQCGAEIPASFACPGCKEQIALQPGDILGCIKDDCSGRLWKSFFCPSCDQEVSSLSVNVQPQAASTSADKKEGDQEPAVDLDVAPQMEQAFGMMDALCAGVLASPQAMANPMIKQLVEQLQAKKAEFLTMEISQPPPLSYFQELADAPLPPIPIPGEPPEVIEAPKPIDGQALGRQLLGELGLTGDVPAKKESEKAVPQKDVPGTKKAPTDIMDHRLVQKAIRDMKKHH